MSTSVTVTVPGTTANIGPGFDCLGAALTIYNRFTFTPLDQPAGTVIITVKGLEADRVSTDASNLAYQAFVYYCQQRGMDIPAVAIDIDLAVPLARGLGSSSTAIVGGLLGANALAKNPLDQAAVATMAIAIEGHPDNVVPALVGAVNWPSLARMATRPSALCPGMGMLPPSSSFPTLSCLPLPPAESSRRATAAPMPSLTPPTWGCCCGV